MRQFIILVFFSFSILPTNAHDLNLKLLMGIWYQCDTEQKDIIVLNREKCFVEERTNLEDETNKNYFECAVWNFKLNGSCFISNDSSEVKKDWKIKKELLLLDDMAFEVLEVKNNQFDEFISLTLVKKGNKGFYNNIKTETNKLDLLLNENWDTKIIDSGFVVFYDRAKLVERYAGYFFKDNIPDSISWYSLVGSFIYKPSNEYLREQYSKNGVLSIEVTFQPKWTNEDVSRVQMKNDILKDKILEQPVFKTSERLFSDYRFWLPLKRNWGSRTKMYDYYFERLPYESVTSMYSILINSGKPFYFARPLYVDDNDSLFFQNNDNDLENEYNRTLRIVAISLGIQDFEIIN